MKNTEDIIFDELPSETQELILDIIVGRLMAQTEPLYAFKGGRSKQVILRQIDATRLRLRGVSFYKIAKKMHLSHSHCQRMVFQTYREISWNMRLNIFFGRKLFTAMFD